MSQYAKHVFVCTQGPYCSVDGDTDALFRRLKKRVAAGGGGDEIRVNRAGCFNQCGHGPMVVVYPEGVWYGSLSLADADAIVDEHLLGGRPVERLRYQATPGSHKDTENYPPEAQEFKKIQDSLDEQREALRREIVARLRQP